MSRGRLQFRGWQRIVALLAGLVPDAAASVPPPESRYYDDMSVDERTWILSEAMSVSQREVSFYWQDRKTVSLVLHFDTSGRVTRTDIQENHGSARDADSVRAVVQGWVLAKEWVRDRPAGQWPATFAMDRGGSTYRERSEALPPPIGELLRKHPLVDWLQALRSIHPEASPDYFRSYGSWHVFKIRWKRGLRDETMRGKGSCGLLLTSPGGTYVLDPFVGSEVYDGCKLGADVDRGFSVFENASGDRTWYDVSTTSSIHVSAWADDSTFVMAGACRIDHADSSKTQTIEARVPLIWVGDARIGVLWRYLGAPMDPIQEERFRMEWSRLRRENYPELSEW